MTKGETRFSIGIVTVTVVSAALFWGTQNVLSESAFPDGTLVKSPMHQAVYQIEAGKRRPFPNANVYNTWYDTFAGVTKISVEEMENIELGNPMPIKPNTKLLKFPLNPKIYAVYDGELIKHIPDPTTAVSLFGATWEKKIIELPEIFFLFYTKGGQIGSSEKVVSPEKSEEPPCPTGMKYQTHEKFGFAVCHDPAGAVLETEGNIVLFTNKSGGALSTYQGKITFSTGFATAEEYMIKLDLPIQQSGIPGKNTYGVEHHSFAGGTSSVSGYHVVIQHPTTKKIYHLQYTGVTNETKAFTIGLRDTFRFID